MPIKWDEDQVAQLYARMVEGTSAADLARELTRQGHPCTRNAVNGAIQRYKAHKGIKTKLDRHHSPEHMVAMSRQANAHRPRKLLAQRKVKVAVKSPETRRRVYVSTTLAQSLHVALFDLKTHHCRFPTKGEGRHTLFCGLTKSEGSSYCPYHHGVTHAQRV